MGSYKKVDSLIADITDSEFFRDHPNIVNKQSIYRWVRLALKQFGMNIMQKKSTLIDVENYRAQLPEDFGKLSLALFCIRNNFKVNGDKKECEKSYIWKDKVLGGYFPNADSGLTDDCEQGCEEDEEKCIVEKYEVTNDTSLHFHYSHIHYVSLGRDVLHNACTGDCVNRFVQDNVFSINIKGTTVYAQFKEGNLYVEYYALPSDEEGLPVIPETSNGYLESYIEYHVKRRLLEDAMLSKDAQNIFTIFQFFEQKERELEGQAFSDTSPLSLQSFWDAISKKRADQAKFNINLGTRYELPQTYRHSHRNTYWGGDSWGRGQSTTYVKN